MDPPSEADWLSEDWEGDLDAEWAYRNFHGKTMEEAVRLFEDDAMSCSEDLMSMPSRVFGFYLRAYLEYLTTTGAINDSDEASRFISLIHFKAENEREDLVPLWAKVEPVLKWIVAHQVDSAEEWKPKGSFRARIQAIVKLGFEATFDTAQPDIVPDYVTLKNILAFGGGGVSFPVAAQIFRNSGIDKIDAASSRTDILEEFGAPDAGGGGDHPEYGRIADWIIYNRPECVVHFQFDGDAVSSVVFMSHAQWDQVEATICASENREIPSARRAAVLAAWGLSMETFRD